MIPEVYRAAGHQEMGWHLARRVHRCVRCRELIPERSHYWGAGAAGEKMCEWCKNGTARPVVYEGQEDEW